MKTQAMQAISEQVNDRSFFRRARITGAASLAASLMLAGCGGGLGVSGGTTGGGTAAARGTVTGSVWGGRYGVSGATIQMYSVGSTGLASSTIPLITGTTVKTDLYGFFSIPAGAYNCTNGTEVFIASTGGDSAGTQGNVPANLNPHINLIAALGSCSYVLGNAANIVVDISEQTTVAAAYALAPFATDFSHIGAATAFDPGIVNAFATAQELANNGNGNAGGISATGAVIPVTAMNTLADIIATCVNTTGSAGQACTDLATATGATDSFGQALAFAKNPASTTLTALYAKTSTASPYQPTYATQPNDFAIAIKYVPGGTTLKTPYGIAIDASGNAWVTNESGTTVTEFGPQGTVLATPTATNLFGAQGVAVDRSGNVWVANTAGNSVVKYTITAGAVSATNSYTSGVNAPSAIAIDSAGNAFFANFNGNSVAEITAGGGTGGPFTGSGNITVPSAVAVDAAGNVYATSGQGTVVKLSNAGAYLSSASDSALQGPVGLAVDSGGHIFATGSTTGASVAGAVGEYTTTGAISAASPVQSGVNTPVGVAVDGTSAWIANSTTTGGLAQVKYGATTSASPSAGFLVQNATVNTPAGVAVDASGNVWVTNSGENTVSKYVGIAAAVKVPLAANVGP